VYNFSHTAPIAIYDSGIGGLTIALAIKKLLPQERIHYIADTENLPYGEKKKEELEGYIKKVVNFCLERGYKLLVIACNTATAASNSFLSTYLTNIDQPLHIVNVIDPIVNHIKTNKTYTQMGLIGTTYTVASQAYEQELKETNLLLFSLATPELVPMIEASFCGESINTYVLHRYLKELCIKHIDAIILACTHYLFLKQELALFFAQKYHKKVTIIDIEKITALAVKDFLSTHNLLNASTQKQADCFMATKVAPALWKATEYLFQQSPVVIHLK